MSNDEILNSTFAFIIDLLTLYNNQIYTQNKAMENIGTKKPKGEIITTGVRF